MCGIAGFFEPSRSRCVEDCDAIARRMASALAHRGPDDEGSWADARAGVGLGHRRLAILDLSGEGRQPMRSADGRYVLSFNGEVYNFEELRRALESKGHRFRGHSDTEVMLAAMGEWGLSPALERFVGMFAFALWDRAENRLHLARDRAGEKPLFYGWAGDAFVFASELKALRAHPGWRGRIDRDALALLVRYGHVPSPRCIHEDLCKLPPGCSLTMTQAHIRMRRTPCPETYWSLRKVAEAGAARPFCGDAREAAERLQELLSQSVAGQSIADVPVGAFLSGGIDSSLVAAAMQAQSPRPIQTFSIGFEQESFDEAPFAKAVARHLGTDHAELYVRDNDLRQVIPELPRIYDEPLADPSQIPTVLLCRLARARVKVCLSGDAGDELFGGYDRYRKTQRLWRAMAGIPGPIRTRLAWGLKTVAEAGRDLGIGHGRAGRLLNRASNLAELLPSPTDRSLYQMLVSPNRHPGEWLSNASEPGMERGGDSIWNDPPDLLHRMMGRDFVSYLPDDILVKVDRAAMSAGLETRVPLLDHRLVEFAWSLPVRFKQRGLRGKWLLRRLLHRYVPRALVDRPKRGFAAPLAQWLREPLRDWAEDLLDAARLRQDGYFKPRAVRLRWHQHLSGERDWSPGLWHVLMFQAWLEDQKSAPCRSEVSPAPASINPVELEACQP